MAMPWPVGPAAKAIDLLHFVCQKLIELMTSAIDLCGTQMSADTNGWMDGQTHKRVPKGPKKRVNGQGVGG